jgi:RNA polymerase sigma-70 factor (ECF subfamily)
MNPPEIEGGSLERREEFSELVRPHLASLRRFVVFAVGDADAGEDVVQEALVNAYEAFGRYRETGKFKAWIFQIARRCVVDAARRAGRRRAVEVPLEHADPGRPAMQEEEVMRKEALERILAAVRTLPQKQRVVFAMREFSGLKFREIARISGAPLGTTLARMRYALRALRSKLGDYHAMQ